MSAPTSMSQEDQRSQASLPSRQPPAATPSIAPSTNKPHHSPSARPKTHQSPNRASTVIGSRIEKKQPTTHKTGNAAPATASGLLIRVLLNNRLGTRTEIPCSPSDSIGSFKRVAAAYLGTRPEAILLKRQGERPFKDTLTLEDYEIRNGSSLDLEVDMGDG